DPIAVYHAFRRALHRAQRTSRPQLLEVMTCRYREHVGPGEDVAAGYRTSEEIDRWKACDPLILEAARLDDARRRITAEIDAAVEFAERSPWPDKTELLADVL